MTKSKQYPTGGESMNFKSDWMYPFYYSTQNGLCEFFNNPVLWSESFIHKTMERSGSKPFNYEDVQTIVKDYLSVVSEYVRRGSYNW